MIEKKRGASAKKKSAKEKLKGFTRRTNPKIQNKEVYDITLMEIESLMKKGENKLSPSELNRLNVLAEAAETFEDQHDPLPTPSTLSDMIRIKMLQLKLKQHFTAKLSGVSEAKFSLIMNGKQKPGIYFIKALCEKLNLDGNEVLKAV